MRVLVVGYGSMGRRHARNSLALGWSVSVLDPDRQSMVRAVEDGFALYDGSESYDAAVVATPAETHASVVRSLLDVPVLVEKPLAPRVVEAEWMLASPRRIHVGYNWRHHPGVLLARDYTRTIAVERAGFCVVCDKSTWPGRGYADMLLEASHEIDLALWLLGPASVSLAQSTDPDRWLLQLVHASGTRTDVILDGRAGNGSVRYFELFGTGIGPAHAVIPVIRLDVSTPERWKLETNWLPHAIDRVLVAKPYDPEQSYRDELRAFLNSARYGGSPSCSVTEALDVLRVCDEARRLAGVMA